MDKTSTFVFGLRSKIQMIIAHKTNAPNHKRRLLKSAIQKARKESEAFCACLLKSIVDREGFYANLRFDQDWEDRLLIMYVKWNDHAYSSQQKQVKPPPRIRDHITDYCRNRPGWADEPLQL